MTTPTTAHVVHLTRTIKASREAVFRAWTEPEQMQQWMAPEGMEIPLLEADVRVGGAYRVNVTQGCGSVLSNTATLEVLSPPSVLTAPENASPCQGTDVTLTVILTCRHWSTIGFRC